MTPDSLDDTVAVPPRESVPVALTEQERLDDTVAVSGLARPEPETPRGGLSAELAREISADTRRDGDVLRLLLPTGAEVELDRTVFVGRRPSTPRIYVGPVPRLVPLPSPTREVSATHLEFRRVGGTVVVTDLRSTNGTTVALPGTAPQVLLGGDSAVVTAGTVIDVGDGNLLTIAAGSSPRALPPNGATT